MFERFLVGLVILTESFVVCCSSNKSNSMFLFSQALAESFLPSVIHLILYITHGRFVSVCNQKINCLHSNVKPDCGISLCPNIPMFVNIEQF